MKQNQIKYAVGLMSGTSLDGIDAALISLRGEGIETEYELIHFISEPISPSLRERILIASDPKRGNVELICSLNMELGKYYSDTVSKLLKVTDFNKKLSFIASHGQTIYHQPDAKAPLYPSTLQIGDPSFLAYTHRVDVVFNFRPMDIVDGGNGAPLVPYTDYLLYREEERNILLQNIGGIGNVTVLPKNAVLTEVSAFDTGPGNMMINYATDYFYGKPFDRDGEYGKRGKLIEALFNELKQHPYLCKLPPKSTGREEFGEHFVKVFCKKYSDRGDDLIYTLTYFTAYSIARSYEEFIFPYLRVDEVVVSGGGVYNPLLMKMIRENLSEICVLTQEERGFSSDAKETIAFAILGNETLQRRANNLPSATGSEHHLILGQIALNPWPII